MVQLPIARVRDGDVICQDVFTKRGNLLFSKGRTITPRDIEILQAFIIPSVAIDTDASQDHERFQDIMKNTAEAAQIAPFYVEYDKLVKLLKKAFPAIAAGSFPILDIRTQLEKLLAQCQDYKILSFTPPKSAPADYFYHKSIQVSLTAHMLGKWHGLPSKDWTQIALAGLFHDIGNVKIDPGILQKPGKLTRDEFEEVKRHTVYGYHLLRGIPGINEGVKLAALQHHEREDGSGYPLGAKSEKIHIYAKIVAIADTFHAMTGKRHYKNRISPYLVLEEIYNSSFGKLDPSLVLNFIERVTQLHNGATVRLNDNSVGEIIFTDRMNPTRPWVNVNGNIINLSLERNLYIQELVKH
ncbi:MAG TPA: HD-GYP domain-containing protein [Bacilli bacterium]